MKKNLFIALLCITIGFAYASSNKEYKSNLKTYKKGFEKLYINECGSCHMAYQPEFLPKRSWKKIMSRLNDHFGSDATFDKEDEKKVLKYLLANAGDTKEVTKEYKEFIESINKNKTPLKISEIPYFKKEHKKIAKKFITQEEVKSFANCAACHKDANKGTYFEKNINIPNYGKWDD